MMYISFSGFLLPGQFNIHCMNKQSVQSCRITGKKYEKLLFNETCPPGLLITNEADCREAVSDLGLMEGCYGCHPPEPSKQHYARTRLGFAFDSGLGPGCFWYWRKVFFNTGTGPCRSCGYTPPICKKGTTTTKKTTTTTPTTSESLFLDRLHCSAK